MADNQLFSQALGYYSQQSYAESAALLEQLVEKYPEQARFHHALGRAYGRMAQQADWYDAMTLVRSTRQALEKAVELDGRFVAALEDLMQFYENAPDFLGGGQHKADSIRIALHALCGEGSGVVAIQQCPENLL